MAERDPAAAARANLATMIALVGLLVIAGGLLALAAVVLPFVRGFIIVGLIFALPVAFHYLVWGWWLSQKLKDPENGE